MSNIGTATVASKTWVDLESVVSGLSLTADTAYVLSFEGKGRICNAASAPTDLNTGFPICNEKFGYTHKTGKLYVLNTGANAFIVNIAD